MPNGVMPNAIFFNFGIIELRYRRPSSWPCSVEPLLNFAFSASGRPRHSLPSRFPIAPKVKSGFSLTISGRRSLQNFMYALRDFLGAILFFKGTKKMVRGTRHSLICWSAIRREYSYWGMRRRGHGQLLFFHRQRRIWCATGVGGGERRSCQRRPARTTVVLQDHD